MNSTTPTTELEAVNLMLSVIGELPVDDLRLAETNADVKMALQLLRSATRALQVKGWQFNTNLAVTLDPMPDGTIRLPTNAVRCVPADDVAQDVRFVIRGQKLWDQKSNTFTWTQSVVADVTILLPYEELPEPARFYIAEKAGQRFQARSVGSETLAAFTREDLQDAAVVLADYELDAGDWNFLTGNSSVSGIWAR